MLEYINTDSLFYLVPQDIDHAEVFSFEKNEDNLIVLKNKKTSNIKTKDKLEVFVNSNEGIIYFNSEVINSENNEIKIVIPQDYEILQRRENERVKINTNITIKNDEFEKEVTLIDMSIGGIKISTDEQLNLNSDYTVFFNFDDLNLSFNFIPQRISLVDNDNDNKNEYQISGQINSKSQKDKITLVQYCYKKLFEQSNRK